MKKILAGLILLISTIAVAAAIDDLRLTSRGDGGKIVIEPKDNGGTKVITLEADGQNATITVPNGVTLKVNNLTNVAGTDAPIGGVPAGSIVAFAGSSAPTGWFLCDGSEKSETTYANLFAAIGTTWNTAAKQDGTGGGWGTPTAGNFRLPDLRGVVLRGVGTSSQSNGSGDVSVSLSSFYNDTTAVNGIESAHDHPSFSITTSLSHNHAAFTETTNIENSSGGSREPWYSEGIGVQAYGQTNPTGAVMYADDEYHTHNVSIDVPSYSGSASATVNVPAITSLTTGDIETRTRSTGVNYIIKY